MHRHIWALLSDLRLIQLEFTTDTILDALVSTYHLRSSGNYDGAPADYINRSAYGSLLDVNPRRYLWQAFARLPDANPEDDPPPVAIVCLNEAAVPAPSTNPGRITSQLLSRDQPVPIRFLVPHEGLLYEVIRSSHIISRTFDCTLEKGIEVAMAGIDPRGVGSGRLNRPDVFTQRAVEYILKTEQINCHPVTIQDRFPAIDWPKMRQQLKELISEDVRIEIREKTGIDHKNGVPCDLFPKFCQTQRECEKRITEAALRYSRGWIDIGPDLPGGGGTAVWFYYLEKEIPGAVGELLGRNDLLAFSDPLAEWARRNRCTNPE